MEMPEIETPETNDFGADFDTTDFGDMGGGTDFGGGGFDGGVGGGFDGGGGTFISNDPRLDMQMGKGRRPGFDFC